MRVYVSEMEEGPRRRPGRCSLSAGATHLFPAALGSLPEQTNVEASSGCEVAMCVTVHDRHDLTPKRGEGSGHAFAPAGLGSLHLHICRMGPAPGLL